MKTVTLADGTVVPAVQGRFYRDTTSHVIRQDYDANTPQEFKSDHEDMSELERSIQQMRLLQQQHDLLRNSAARAALEVQIQALTVELNALRAKYGVT